MKHKRTKRTKTIKLLLAAVGILIIGQLVFNLYLFNRVHQTHDTTILTLISQALDGLYKPAAVEPKTGNSYFPEARLYVTAQPNNPALLYNYYSDGDQMTFNVTATNVLSAGKSKLWSRYTNGAQQGNSAAYTAAFDELPHLQACARGLQLFYTPQTLQGLTEQFHVTLDNGKTLYGYTEVTCQQDLSPLISAFKTVQSY